MDGKKIYLVTSGSYSDYGVNAAFSTKEAAEEYIARFKGVERSHFNDVEEVDLDPYAEAKRDGVWPFIVTMNVDGSNAVAHRLADDWYECNRYFLARDATGLYLHGCSGRKAGPAVTVQLTLLARDESHAIKITYDQLLQWLAENPSLPETQTTPHPPCQPPAAG